MKKDKRPVEAAARPSAAIPATGAPWWVALVLACAAVVAYIPALGGPFLFDDMSLPMLGSNAADSWFSFVQRGVRAVTNLSFVADRTLWGLNTGPYHVENLLLHLVNAWLAFLILRRLLTRAGRAATAASWGAALGSALFLLHPLQTEAVSYIASRSEVLCAFFSYLALLLAISRPGALGVVRSAGVLLLLALGVAAKEPAVAMAAVLILTDVWFGEQPDWAAPLKRWMLYAPMLLGGLAGGWTIYHIVAREGSAGKTAGIAPIDYLLTQGKVVWLYLRLMLLPVGQNIDHAFPATRMPGDALAWLGLAGILALAVAAWALRRRYPVASLGLLMFLLLLAPTSSILPIADTMVERRVYLGSLGLAAIAAEFVARIESRRAVRLLLAGLAVVLAGWTWQHNALYASSEAMWQSAVNANPSNSRAHFQLADAYFREGRCAEALPHFNAVAQLEKPDYRLLVNWSQALDCAGDSGAAVEKLRAATRLERNHAAWSALGMVLAKRGDLPGALKALEQALELQPGDEATLVYRGNVYLLMNDAARALADYQAALKINPEDQAALQGRMSAERALSGAQ